MHPILIDFGPFSLHSYGLAMAVAFGAGIWIAMRRAGRRGLSSKFILDLSVLVLIFSILGARALYVITHWEEFSGHPLDIISPFQSSGQIGIAGLVLLGGVIAAFFTILVYSRKHGHPFFLVGDVLAPSTALGIALGRIGCYFNGCCFGFPTDAAWCVVFPAGSLAGSVFPDTCVHPTQLYEAGYMLLVFGGLLLYDRKTRPVGQLSGLFLLLYGIGRFFIESLRWYESEMIIAETGTFRFTVSQLISLVMVLGGLVLLLHSLRRKPAAAA